MIDQVCDHRPLLVDDTLRLDGKVAKKMLIQPFFMCPTKKNLPSRSLFKNCKMNFQTGILSADRILKAHLYVGNSC